MDAALVPPGADVRTVTTSAGDLRVLHAESGERTGDWHGDHDAPAAESGAQPVVLIHGGGSDSAAVSWYHLFEPLGRDRDVWAIDLPGFGGSIDVPPVGGPGALADVVVETLRLLDVGPAVVVGISMGGDVALELALDHPDVVAGLTLISPGGLAPRLGGALPHAGIWSMTLLPDALLVPLARVANQFSEIAMKALVSDPSSLPQEVVDEFVRLSRDPRGSMGYGRYNQATVGPFGMLNDKSALTFRIRVSALIVHGEDDRMVDPEGSRRAAERMPDCRLVEIPDCGHWGQLDKPDLFLDLLQEFLGEIDAA